MEILNLKVRLFLLLLTALLGSQALLLSEAVDEYEVKAAFLFHFTKFIEWPPTHPSLPFSICIVGDDPFGTAFDKLVKGKTVAGRPIEIRKLKEVAAIQTCHIAFVRSLEKAKASKLIEVTRGTPVLSVGENEDFVKTGGIASLSMDDGRVGVAINPRVAEKARLKVSAKLLTLAKIVTSDEPGK